MLSLTYEQWRVFLVELILLAPLIAVLLAITKWLLPRPSEAGRREHLLGWATRLLSGVSLVCSVVLASGQRGTTPLEFSIGPIDFYLDALSIYFVLLVNLVAFFASWYTVQFLNYDVQTNAERHEPEFFHVFFNLFHLTMLLVPMVDNLIILWMAIELTTLASTFLVRYRRQRRTLEAAWKYIIITTAGIVFALFGTILLGDAIRPETCVGINQNLHLNEASCVGVPGASLLRWSVLGQATLAQTLDPKLVVLSFLFVLVGYGTKAGFAPMHTWLPDGHGEAPSPVSALLSGVLLKSALYAILRFYTITNLNLGNTLFTSRILLFSGLLSLVVATPFILKRNRFKRILAYHSLEHMGIIVFAIGVGGSLALFGALLHALNHALTKAFMFLNLQNIRHGYFIAGCPEDDDEQISGVLKDMPLTGGLLLFGGLGLVGSPPFNIFLSEFIILWAAIDRVIHPSDGKNQLGMIIYALAVTVFLLTVTIIFAGLVGHLSHMLLGPAPFRGLRDRLRDLAPLAILMILITVFGFWIPTVPINFPALLNQSVCILQQGAGGGCLP
jgi:hydrogenase-4 component F